jgi:hypothetical protein
MSQSYSLNVGLLGVVVDGKALGEYFKEVNVSASGESWVAGSVSRSVALQHMKSFFDERVDKVGLKCVFYCGHGYVESGDWKTGPANDDSIAFADVLNTWRASKSLKAGQTPNQRL